MKFGILRGVAGYLAGLGVQMRFKPAKCRSLGRYEYCAVLYCTSNDRPTLRTVAALCGLYQCDVWYGFKSCVVCSMRHCSYCISLDSGLQF